MQISSPSRSKGSKAKLDQKMLLLTIITSFVIFDCFNQSPFTMAKRKGVIKTGITIWPDIKAKRGKRAETCPQSHPFACGEYLSCCSQRHKKFNPDLDPHFDGKEILSSDSVDTCNGDYISCPYEDNKCRTNPQFRKKPIRYLLASYLQNDYEVMTLVSLDPKNAPHRPWKNVVKISNAVPIIRDVYEFRNSVEFNGRFTTCSPRDASISFHTTNNMNTQGWCVQYDHDTETWTLLHDVKIGDSGVQGSLAVMNGNLWTTGGWHGTFGNRISKMDQLVTETWEWDDQSAVLPKNLFNHRWVTVSDYEAVILGGIDDTAIRSTNVQTKVYLYTHGYGFTNLASLPEPKAQFIDGFFIHPNGTRYVIAAGGITDYRTSPNQRYSKKTFLYNVDGDTWHTDDSMDLPDNFVTKFSGVMFENVFYVGGCLSSYYPPPLDYSLDSDDILAFMYKGPNDFTWTKVHETGADGKLCGSFETLSEELHYH